MWNRIIKNTIWLTAGEAISRLIRLVIVIYSARVLGAADWGVLSYALSLAVVFTVAADIGLGAVVTREIIRKPEERDRYLSTGFYLKIILTIIAGLIIVFVGPYFTALNISSALLIFTALLVVCDTFRLYSYSIIRSLEKMYWEAITNIVTQASLTAIGLLALWYAPSSENLVAAYAVGSFLGLVLISFVIRNYLKRVWFFFDKRLILEILKISWPFALLGLLGTIMLNTDIIILSWFTDAADIGHYSAGQKIVLTLYILPALLSTALFPNLARLAEKNKEAVANLVSKAIKASFIAAMPFMIGGILTALQLINLLYGAEYLPGVLAFQILLLSLPINFPSTILGNTLFAYDKQRLFLKYGGFATALNIILDIILIPYWGIAGAAAATVFVQLISNWFFWRKVQEISPFSIRGLFGKIIFASITMGLLVALMVYFELNFFLIFFSAIISYFIILWFIKEELIRSLMGLIMEKFAQIK